MMSTITGSTASNAARTIYGKLIGVTPNRDVLQAICDGLTTIGVREVEVLDGPTGVQQLDKWRDAAARCFFGDMEEDLVVRYLAAINQRLIIFAAVVLPETADQAAEMAKAKGAGDVVYFGNSVVTSY